MPCDIRQLELLEIVKAQPRVDAVFGAVQAPVGVMFEVTVY